jgi:sec-independent protein translocase protein TatA
MIGMWELILIFAIVVLLFGARRLPEIARGIGKGVREFRKALSGEPDGQDEKKLSEGGKPEQSNGPVRNGDR